MAVLMQVIATNNELNTRIKNLELIIKKNEDTTKINNCEFAMQSLEIKEYKKEIAKKLLIISNSEDLVKQLCEAHLKEVSIINKEKQELQMEIKRVKYELENALSSSVSTNSGNRSRSMGAIPEKPVTRQILPIDNIPLNASPLTRVGALKTPPNRVTFDTNSHDFASKSASKSTSSSTDASASENEYVPDVPKREIVRDTSHLHTITGYNGAEAVYAVVVKPTQNTGKFKISSGSHVAIGKNVPEWQKTSSF